MTKDMTCIVCPNGCFLKVEQNGDEINVTGATCKRGIEFAKNELTNPMRTITSTVATKFEDFPLLTVKTAGEFPKDKIFDAMKKVNAVTVDKRLAVGDVVIEDLYGTSLVATADMTLHVEPKRDID